MVQKTEFKLISDHILISLSTGYLSSGLRPYKFFNTWCSDQEFQSFVPNVWREIVNRPSSLWGKFNQLRSKIKIWQSTKFAASIARSKAYESELAELLDNNALHNEEELELFVSKKRELSLELQHLRTIEKQC